MGRITVIGTGFEEKHLTLEAVELLQSGAKVLLHTGRCGCAEWLARRGIPFETLDELYEQCEDFDEHARLAAEAVCRAAEAGDVVYGVFDVRDRSVSALLGLRSDASVVPGPPTEGALMAYAGDSVQLLEASDWENYVLSPVRSALVRELDSRELAAEVKLKLMEVYPEESEALVWIGGGLARTPLYNLDRLKGYDHRTCALALAINDLTQLERFDVERFEKVVEVLCAPGGCPWDRQQTHASLRQYIVEEAYEVVDAIDEGDPDHLYDELGDMLYQVVLHAEIGRRHGEFDMRDVATAISRKLIRRHSHIFGGDTAQNADEVEALWNRNKMKERGEKTASEFMRDVSRSMPAAMRAAKVLKRRDQATNCAETEQEALNALRQAVSKLDGADERDVGELMLRAAAFARARGVEPELALNAATDRLIDRFAEAEKR